MSARRTLVALLRGINVGGRNSVPMAGLRSVLEELGLDDVTTYIQSGNVVFRSRTPVKSLPSQLEDAIADAFGGLGRVVPIAIALLVFAIGFAVFKRNEPWLAERT